MRFVQDHKLTVIRAQQVQQGSAGFQTIDRGKNKHKEGGGSQITEVDKSHGFPGRKWKRQKDTQRSEDREESQKSEVQHKAGREKKEGTSV